MIKVNEKIINRLKKYLKIINRFIVRIFLCLCSNVPCDSVQIFLILIFYLTYF